MERKPSEVFLKLWRWRTTNDTTATDEDFTLCAEAWEEIRRMECELAWEKIREGMDGERQSLTADAEPPLHKGAEDPPTLPVKVSSWQIWKDRVRERLLSTRFSIEKVAEAAEVKIDDVRALADSTQIPAALIKAIERGLEKLEG